MKKCPTCNSEMDRISPDLAQRLSEALAPVDGWSSPIIEGFTCICGATLLLHSPYDPNGEDAREEQKALATS